MPNKPNQPINTDDPNNPNPNPSSPPVNAFAPPMPTGNDGPLPDSEQKEETE